MSDISMEKRLIEWAKWRRSDLNSGAPTTLLQGTFARIVPGAGNGHFPNDEHRPLETHWAYQRYQYISRRGANAIYYKYIGLLNLREIAMELGLKKSQTYHILARAKSGIRNYLPK